MDVTNDRKTNSNIKSSFMHNLLHIVIFFNICKCLLMLLLLKCSNKSLPLAISVKIMFRECYRDTRTGTVTSIVGKSKAYFVIENQYINYFSMVNIVY